MIYVSLPHRPDAYPRQRFWHAQMAYFVVRGLEARFGQTSVQYVPWGAAVDPGPRDLLVTCLPNVNYGRTRRIVALENDTLRQSRWESDRVEVHGRTWSVDDVRPLRDRLEGVAAAVVLTNDVALERLAAGDSDYLARDEALRRHVGSLAYAVHPMDKETFRRHFPKEGFRRDAPLAIYHGGWRKSSAEILAVALEAGLRVGRDFVPFAHLRKGFLPEAALFRWRFNIVASGSLSESGPANLLEFMYQGFHILGHDEWWPDFGGHLSQFSYDPSRRTEMRELLRYLADPAATEAIQRERDRILALNVARTDNTWDAYLELVFEAIDNSVSHR